jgi:tRNA modification GTPase
MTLFFFKGPRSYTGQDMIELYFNAPAPIVERIVSLLVDQGARLARPGEFTLRAFLHGKMDLTQAEAVISIVHARHLDELKAASAQLAGGISTNLHHLEEALLDLCADVEAAIDFSDQDIEIIPTAKLTERIQRIKSDLEQILHSSRRHQVKDRSYRVLIFGASNTGKSTLFNQLVGYRRAITSQDSPTTRDLISAHMSLEEGPLQLFDSAGWISQTDNPNQLAVERTLQAIQGMDLILLVIDGTDPQSSLRLKDYLKGYQHLVIWNKVDLTGFDMAMLRAADSGLESPIFISALKGYGIKTLWQAMKARITRSSWSPQDIRFICQARCIEGIQNAVKGLQMALESLQGKSLEFASLDLREAYHSLGLISGRTADEDILERIFSKFCIGK